MNNNGNNTANEEYAKLHYIIRNGTKRKLCSHWHTSTLSVHNKINTFGRRGNNTALVECVRIV